MNTPSWLAEATVLLPFIACGLLPLLFFKPGRFGPAWLLTALPFGIGAGCVFASGLGWLPSETGSLRTLASVLGLGATALIMWAWYSNRHRLALWHQPDDAPHAIQTDGAYRYMRHPFYSAFLLMVVAAICLVDHWLPLVSGIYALIALSITARREEHRLLESPFGKDYAHYMQHTGRFVPGLVLK